MTDSGRLTIKEMPLSVRPRERLMSMGAPMLSDAELLGILVRTGRQGETAVDLGNRILADAGDIGKLANAMPEELCRVDGIGEAKAAQVVAAFELGKRASAATPSQRPVVSTPKDAVDLLMSKMRYLDREHFKALVLNTKNQLLRSIDVSIGSLSSSIVHPRELFKAVIRLSGAAVIVAHNHPSGDPTPSAEDILLTRRLVKAGNILGIDLLDHVILGDGTFVSLKERNLM
ncbi:MAG: DNA repair protein RadC [Actinobacteria bacterium]|nr:DNA repair protein RadC [Actinomycetota bacterium]